MLDFRFTDDFSCLKSVEYLEVYNNQSIVHQDYFHHPLTQYAVLESFKKYESCSILSVYNKDVLIGYVTFREVRITLRGFSFSFLVPGTYRVSEYNYPIIHKDFLKDFFTIFNKSTKSKNIFFHNTPAFFKVWMIEYCDSSFVYSVSDNPLLVNYSDDILKASKKKGLVRDFKALNKKLPLEIEHKTDNIPEQDLDIMFDLHAKRWEIENISSKFKSESFCSVYKNLSKIQIDNHGSPIISYLKSGDEILAMHYGFLNRNSFLYQVPVLNLDHKEKSPGSILLLKILEYCASGGLNSIDLGYGMESYKYRFMNDVISYYTLLRFSNSFKNTIYRIGIK